MSLQQLHGQGSTESFCARCCCPPFCPGDLTTAAGCEMPILIRIWFRSIFNPFSVPFQRVITALRSSRHALHRLFSAVALLATMHTKPRPHATLTVAHSYSQPHIRLRAGSAHSTARHLTHCLPYSRHVSLSRCQRSLAGSVLCSGVQTDSKAAKTQALPQLPALDGEHASVVIRLDDFSNISIITLTCTQCCRQLPR